MTIGNTTYITSHIPSSSIPSSLNSIPLPHSHGPLGQNVTAIHVRTIATHVVVSQSQVPPVVSRGRIPTSGGHIPTFRMSIPTYGVSLRKSHGTSYGPYYGP